MSAKFPPKLGSDPFKGEKKIVPIMGFMVFKSTGLDSCIVGLVSMIKIEKWYKNLKKLSYFLIGEAIATELHLFSEATALILVVKDKFLDAPSALNTRSKVDHNIIVHFLASNISVVQTVQLLFVFTRGGKRALW